MAPGGSCILQENPPRVELLDWEGRLVATRIALEIPEGHPLHDSWVDAEKLAGRRRRVHAERPPPDRQGEGPARPSSSSGRRAMSHRGSAPSPRSRAARGGRSRRATTSSSRSRSGTHRSSWRPPARTSATSRSDPTDGSTCSVTSPSRSPGSGNWSSAIGGQGGRGLELPQLDGKPEGLALTRNGRAIVALDTQARRRKNLVLLEPPIAEGRDLVTAPVATSRAGPAASQVHRPPRAPAPPRGHARRRGHQLRALHPARHHASSCSSSSATTRPSRSRRSPLDPERQPDLLFLARLRQRRDSPGWATPIGSMGRRTSTAPATASTRTRCSSTPTAAGTTSTLWDRVAACGPDDNLGQSLRSVVIDMTDYDWEGDEPLRKSMQDTVIYEMHVRGFTKSSTSGATNPGTYPRGHREDPLPPEAGRDSASSCCRSSSSTRTRSSCDEPPDRASA